MQVHSPKNNVRIAKNGSPHKGGSLMWPHTRCITALMSTHRKNAWKHWEIHNLEKWNCEALHTKHHSFLKLQGTPPSRWNHNLLWRWIWQAKTHSQLHDPSISIICRDCRLLTDINQVNTRKQIPSSGWRDISKSQNFPDNCCWWVL